MADRRVLVLGLGLACLYWILESLMDAFVLEDSRFPQSLCAPGAQELWMRLSVLALILLCWVALQSLLVHRRRTEEALRRSEERYRNVYSMTPLALVLWDPGCRVLDWNRRAEELFGWAKEEVIGKNFFDFLIPGEDKAPVGDLVARILDSRSPTLSANRNVTKDGRVLSCEWYTSLLHDDEGRVEGVISLGLDITERSLAERALRESEAKSRGLFEAVSGGVVMQDAGGRIVEVNDEACEILGLTKDQMRGLTSTDPRWHSVREDGSPFPGEEHPLPVTLRTGRPVRGAVTGVYNPSLQAYRWLLVNSEPIIDPATGAVQAAVATFVDITERKEAENRVKAALKEKEVLLREIHHRVRNNLHVISTLLDLQASSITDEAALHAFRESQSRVMSMALVHERLYQSENLARIDLKPYIEDLTAHLLRAFGAHEGQVELSLDVGDVPLSIDSAIGLGLILNELVSNSLKHAFPGERPGRIVVSLGRSPGESVELRVSDDGVGLPPALDIRKTQTLGLQLVDTLVRQIGGDIRIEPGPGTTFAITFHEPPRRHTITP